MICIISLSNLIFMHCCCGEQCASVQPYTATMHAYQVTEKKTPILIKTSLFGKQCKCKYITLNPMRESHLPNNSNRYRILHADIDRYLLKYRAVILVSPDENLRDGADCLHKKVSVVICHCGVFGKDMVHIPGDARTKCMRNKILISKYFTRNMHRGYFIWGGGDWRNLQDTKK